MRNIFVKFSNIFSNIKNKSLDNSRPKIIAKNTVHLEKLIRKEINFNGNYCDLNHIDVSRIWDMRGVFHNIPEFNGDISKWDTSNVTNMQSMFEKSQFNGDISNWNVSRVENMAIMFSQSEFNGDISNWDVSNVIHMGSMFAYSKFKQNLSKWIPLKLKDSFYIFSKCDIAEPYWTDEENRKKAIDAYNLHKELSSELISDKANNKPKKLKI